MGVPEVRVVDVAVGAPLGLNPMGDWDPAEEYWGEPGEPLPPMWLEVIAGGIRPCFEMEQILPGVDADDWHTDPIVDAAELHRAGYHREAIRRLERLLGIDVRCVDAWSQLGLVPSKPVGRVRPARSTRPVWRSPKGSLPERFAGVLPRGTVDDRPFLRCLHGLALCAWRQRRWDDAEAMFTARVWLDPCGSLDALACLDPVRVHPRWTRT